jgi:acid phosphatase family membrane protein YuiD
MGASDILSNQTLIAALTASLIAQILKVLIDYIKNRSWNFILFFRAGGMPSSHSALVAAGAHSLGLNYGFGSPLFAVATILAIIVIYDATGIRRQAGKHAVVINQIITELAAGHTLNQEQLREILGHTPFEAFIGMIIGSGIAQILYFLWF